VNFEQEKTETKTKKKKKMRCELKISNITSVDVNNRYNIYNDIFNSFIRSFIGKNWCYIFFVILLKRKLT